MYELFISADLERVARVVHEEHVIHDGRELIGLENL